MKPTLCVLLCISLTLLPGTPAWSTYFYAESAAAPTYTYLLNQNFEGTGYDNGETWTPSGSPDPDYASAPLEGSQSLRINESSSADRVRSASYGNTANTTTCLMFKYTTLGAAFSTLARGLQADLSVTWLLLNGSTSGKLRIQHSGTQSGDSTATLSAGTLYYLWIEYEKGTGANGKMRLYISTTTTKPAADTTITTGNGTFDHAALGIGSPTNATQDYLVDHLRVVGNATSVTTWPN